MRTEVIARKNQIRRTRSELFFDAAITVIMSVVFLMTFYPFYYVVIMSFNEGVDSIRGGIYLWPRVFTVENYVKFLSDPKWIGALGMSVAKTSVGTLVSVFFTCMVAYGLSFPNLAMKKFYNYVLIFCMYFSGGLIPYYLTLNQYGLLNTFWVYIIPHAFVIYYCILARSFFSELPFELYESATLDGAGNLTIYLRIVLPLSKPLIATIALFAAVGQWNSWTDTAFYAPAVKALRTLSYLMRDVIMRSQVDSSGGQQAMDMAAQYTKTTTQSVQMAAMVIAVLPIILVYPFLQKYFVKGIMLGAVKG